MARIAVYNKKRTKVKRWIETPKCGVCNANLNNVTTINGVRQYECMVNGCAGAKKKFDQEGNSLGQRT